MTDSLRLALLQTDLAWQDAAANRSLLEPLLAPLAGSTDLVILPEMFTTAFAMGNGALAEPHPGPTLEWMQQQAAKLGAALSGSIAVEVAGKRFNRLLFVTPEGDVSYYDKLHLFRMLGEDKRYSAGKDKVIVEYRGWRILLLVCYDLRFPVFCRHTENTPYDLLLCVANWPAARRQHWMTLLQARAIENQCWVAGVNRVGVDGNGLDYAGDSSVFDPQGLAVVEAGKPAGIYSASLSRDLLLEWRARFPAWMDADTFSLTQAPA